MNHPDHDLFAHSPAMRAALEPRADGAVDIAIEFPDGRLQQLTAAAGPGGRADLLNAARGFLIERGERFGRLTVVDDREEWVLALPSDATQQPVVLARVARNGTATALADALALAEPAATQPHTAVSVPTASLIARVSRRVRRSQRLEDDLNTELTQPRTLSHTNNIAVVSSKGGVGKTANTAQLGACLAASLPNQRVCAIDFNVGGGGLQAIAAEDRATAPTLFDLHRDRDHITSRAQLQSYVSSLPSGLDLITVPPDPELAGQITPQHYADLLTGVLHDNYDICLFDCAPPINSPVTRWALEHASQLVISTRQGYAAAAVVQPAVPELLNTPAARNGRGAIAVINEVITQTRAGSAQETREAMHSLAPDMPVIEIPRDLNLVALLDSGCYDTQLVTNRGTRIAIKQLAVEVCRRLV